MGPSARAIAAAVRSRQVSAREATSAALERIERADAELRAFITVDGELAMRQAERIDARLAAGDDVGPLCGVPIGVKDLDHAAGFRTTFGSVLHADDPVQPHDTEWIRRLRAAGCVVVGKTNTSEHGSSTETDNAVRGRTTNPHDPRRSVGGSSGGSAAAVAAGVVPLATATDSGGSARLPAAVCGVVGFKPTHGLLPRWPTVPAAPALTSGGLIAQDPDDIAVALAVAAGVDPRDLDGWPSVPPLAGPHDGSDGSLAGLAIAWTPTLGYATVDPSVAEAAQSAALRASALGATVTTLDAVFDTDPIGSWICLFASGLLAVVSEQLGSERGGLLTTGLRDMLMRAGDLPAVKVELAHRECHRVHARLVEVFDRADVLLTPATAGCVPLAHRWGTIDGREVAGWVQFTYPFNMARCPAGVVPCGRDANGMPVAVQVVGPRGADATVLRVMSALHASLRAG